MRGSSKITFILGSIIGTLFTAGSALAQSPGNVRVGIPSYSGTGCPTGSLAATVSPDGLSLSILFSSLQTNVGGSRVAYERKSCSVSLPVTVPQGYQMMISRVDYRGYALIPQGTIGSFDIRYAFTGMAGLGFQQTFRTVQNSNFTLSNTPVDDRSAWTSCGSSTTTLSTTTNLALQSNLNNQQATLIIDSADSASGLTYELKFARCANQPAPAPTTQSNCQVMNGANAAGTRLYRVIDRMGRILLSTTDNQQAIQTAQTDQRCFQ